MLCRLRRALGTQACSRNHSCHKDGKIWTVMLGGKLGSPDFQSCVFPDNYTFHSQVPLNMWKKFPSLRVYNLGRNETSYNSPLLTITQTWEPWSRKQDCSTSPEAAQVSKEPSHHSRNVLLSYISLINHWSFLFQNTLAVFKISTKRHISFSFHFSWAFWSTAIQRQEGQCQKQPETEAEAKSTPPVEMIPYQLGFDHPLMCLRWLWCRGESSNLAGKDGFLTETANTVTQPGPGTLLGNVHWLLMVVSTSTWSSRPFHSAMPVLPVPCSLGSPLLRVSDAFLQDNNLVIFFVFCLLETWLLDAQVLLPPRLSWITPSFLFYHWPASASLQVVELSYPFCFLFKFDF